MRRVIGSASGVAGVCFAAGLALGLAGLASASEGVGGLAGPMTPSVPRGQRAQTLPDSAEFTVIGLPDTQNYSEFFPSIYHRQTSWTVENRFELNTRFVTHYGDVVNHGDRENEWAVARSAMSTLHASGIPYSVTAGNHDITPSGGAGTPYIPQKYLENFGPQHFQGREWYTGASPSGMSSAQKFSGGGREFLHLNIVCDTPVNELAWAQGIVNQNPSLPVMITTHRYLQDAEDYTGGVPLVPSGRYPGIWYGFEGLYHPEGVQSNEFFENFVRINKQVFMVNCGHFHEEFRQTSTNLYGGTVHEVLADYQDDPNGGDGFLRIMKFNPSQNRINVQSYSPTRNEFRTAGESQFTLNVNFNNHAFANPTATFQQGISGYSGTRDTWVNEASPNTSYGDSPTFDSDDDTTNSIFNDRRGQALLRFDNITTGTGEAGKIPLGATITSATIRLAIEDDIDTPLFNPRFFVHQLQRDWSESSTWNSLSGGLSGSEIGPIGASFIGDNNPDGDYWRLIDITGIVQNWANGTANFGLAILPEIISGNDDGITIWSSEAANPLLRPQLQVSWILGGAVVAVPSPGAAAVLGMAAVVCASRRRRAAERA